MAADRHVVPVIQTSQRTVSCLTLLILGPDDCWYVQKVAGTVCPELANVTGIFALATDPPVAPDRDFLTKQSRMIKDEDNALMENRRPGDLPPDIMDKVHTVADRWWVAYGRALAQSFGPGTPLGNLPH